MTCEHFPPKPLILNDGEKKLSCVIVNYNTRAVRPLYLPAVELGNRRHDSPLLVIPQFGEDRQGQRFFRDGFRHWHVSGLVAQVGKALLQMQRYRIVNLGANPAGGEE